MGLFCGAPHDQPCAADDPAECVWHRHSPLADLEYVRGLALCGELGIDVPAWAAHTRARVAAAIVRAFYRTTSAAL